MTKPKNQKPRFLLKLKNNDFNVETGQVRRDVCLSQDKTRQDKSSHVIVVKSGRPVLVKSDSHDDKTIKTSIKGDEYKMKMMIIMIVLSLAARLIIDPIRALVRKFKLYRRKKKEDRYFTRRGITRPYK